MSGALVRYLYLADGTKLAALRDGTGYIYCGSMVYEGTFTGSSSLAAFESTGFSAGRIVKNGSAIVPTYHVNDYLCSVRVVTDATGDVLERNDYSGFGKRLESSTGSLNRYRFSGKEEQTLTVPGWQDFGARMYDPDLARWTTPDPLAYQYPGISPYAYCAGDPVNFVDPEGKVPLLFNFAVGFVSAGVEYGSQVIGNIVSNGFAFESFTNVDLFDVGIAFGEGFITSGTNVARKIVAKTAVGLAGEITRNAVNLQVGDGKDHTLVINSLGNILVDTAIGVVSEVISFDVNISPFKGVSNTKAVRTARETANIKGETLSSQTADRVRKHNKTSNAEKVAANQALSDILGSTPSSATSEIIKRLKNNEKY